MLKLYHVPISPNSRRVWIALLEKGLQFELIELDVANGAQFQPEFLAINPFHHIPVLRDGDFNVIESLAILDYLEAQYPQPALLPKDPQAIAKVRMVEMVVINELVPAMGSLIRHYIMGIPETDPEKLEQSKWQCQTVLSFLDKQLADRPFFGGENLSLADIVAGVSVPWLPQMDVPFDTYLGIEAWSQRLQARPSWQGTQPTPETVAAFRKQMKGRMA